MKGLTFKTDLAAKMGKLDAFDAKKFDDIQTAVADAMQLTQDVKAEKAEREKLEAKMEAIEEKNKLLEAALNRPAMAVTPEAKERELKAKGTKLFNQFARKRSENQTYFDDYVDGVQAIGDEKLDEVEKKALTVNSDPQRRLPDHARNSAASCKPTCTRPAAAPTGERHQHRHRRLELVTDNDQAGWGWVGETQARPDTYTPQLGKLYIPVNEMYAMPNASQKMLDDAMIDVETWLAGKVAEVFARGEAQAFISGNGMNKPLGILSYAAGTSVGQQQGAAGQPAKRRRTDLRRAGGITEHTQRAVPAQRRIPDAAGEHGRRAVDPRRPGAAIFNPVYDKNAGLEGYIMGRPIYIAADMPVIGTNALAVAYGDFKQAYQIVDRFGVRVLRDRTPTSRLSASTPPRG